MSKAKTTDGISDYARGMLDAIRIAKEVQAEMEAPVNRVRDEVGAAYVVLNGAKHWGQSVLSAAESRIMKHLIASNGGEE